MTDQLTDVQTRMLDFEREWWRYAGEKHTAIKAEFRMTPEVYHADLDAFIHTPEALAHDSMLVKRLRRLSAQRRRRASA